MWTEKNPLISPCKCDGTAKYIHLHCLQQLASCKASKEIVGSSLLLSWNKRVKCDLCKVSFPESIELNNTHSELLNIPKPPGMYIVFENLQKIEEKKKEFCVLFFGNNNREKILIGRSVNCGLRLLNNCVSREHAEISCSRETVWLKDTGSKFGTLVQIRRPLMIEMKKEIGVQIGRSLIMFHVTKPWSLLPGCFSRKNKSYDVFNPRRQSLKGILVKYNIGISISVKEVKDNKENKHKNRLVSEGDGENQVFLYLRENKIKDNQLETEPVEGNSNEIHLE